MSYSGQIATAGTGQAPAAEEDSHLVANRDYFNKQAHKYDDRPAVVKITRAVGEFVTSKYHFDEDKTVLLDFACGTGLVSQALAPHCKKIVGVDISQGMVDWYNMRVWNQGIEPEEMKAVCTELKGAEGELDGVKFDVAICSMAYHHFTDIDVITKTLSYHLKPGGKLMVVDIVLNPSLSSFWSSSHRHEGAGHGDQYHQHADEHVHNEAGREHDEQLHSESFPVPPENVVAHKGGFNRERIEEVFWQAGLREFEWSTVGEFGPVHGQNMVELFLATGVAP